MKHGHFRLASEKWIASFFSLFSLQSCSEKCRSCDPHWPCAVPGSAIVQSQWYAISGAFLNYITANVVLSEKVNLNHLQAACKQENNKYVHMFLRSRSSLAFNYINDVKWKSKSANYIEHTWTEMWTCDLCQATQKNMLSKRGLLYTQAPMLHGRSLKHWAALWPNIESNSQQFAPDFSLIRSLHIKQNGKRIRIGVKTGTDVAA